MRGRSVGVTIVTVLCDGARSQKSVFGTLYRWGGSAHVPDSARGGLPWPRMIATYWKC